MNPSLVYRKTAKGQEAMASRQSMTPKQRSVLILVDGKRTGADLEKIAAALGDGNEILNQLEALGYLEAVGAPAASAPRPVAPPVAPVAPVAAAPVAANAPDGDWHDARRVASRFLTDLMGPNAENLCMRIESARTLQEFTAAVVRARDAVRDFRGAAAAAQFIAAVEARMPQG